MPSRRRALLVLAALIGLAVLSLFVALAAGIIAASLARWMGDLGFAPALAIGALSFGVYGVLLGSGGVELSPTSDDDHGHPSA